MTVNKESIRLKKVDIVKLILLNETNMMLLNMIYSQKCDFNLIFFHQLTKA